MSEPTLRTAEQSESSPPIAGNDDYASQSRLIWLRFRKHRLAAASGVVLLLMYVLALLAPFVSPHDPAQTSIDYRLAPPQRLHFVHEGQFRLRPFVYPYIQSQDMETFGMVYQEDRTTPYPLRLFVDGFEYKVLGTIRLSVHLFGTGNPQVPVHLFGTDQLGRDMLSRTIHAARISLSIGLVGVALSLVLGILIGGIAGYLGGTTDLVAQRAIEILRSIPHLPLWMGLSAAVPVGWSPLQTYFAITVILSLVGWTGLARVVRGRFLSLREEDFVLAARLAGRSRLGIVFLHMLPSFSSHIIASVTLTIPAMILGETALSFLGIGLQAPVVSWGVLLSRAQNVHTIAHAPWLMIPGIFVIITVLSFNFMGDGLRDAADPYATRSQ